MCPILRPLDLGLVRTGSRTCEVPDLAAAADLLCARVPRPLTRTVDEPLA